MAKYINKVNNEIEAVQWNGENIEEMQAFSKRIMFVATSPRPKGATDEEWAEEADFKVILEKEGMDITINEGDYVAKLENDTEFVYTKEAFESLFKKGE